MLSSWLASLSKAGASFGRDAGQDLGAALKVLRDAGAELQVAIVKHYAAAENALCISSR